MYGGRRKVGEQDQPRQKRLEERRQIVERYDLGREEGAIIDDWENPNFELYHKTDRFGFIKDMRIPDAEYRSEKQQKRLEKEINRLPKWLKMEKEWFSRGSKNHNKMVERVWEGVPERLRGPCWSIFLDLNRMKREQVGKYQAMKVLGRKFSPYIRQIDLDVKRTFRNHVMFRERYNSRQQDLFHVLAAYSMFNTEVGYCQGMSNLAALLLMYLNSEEDAFWALSQLMSHPRYNMHGFFIPGFPKLVRYQDHFDKVSSTQKYSVLSLFLSDSSREAGRIAEASTEQQRHYSAVHCRVVLPVFSRPSSIQFINSRLGLVLAGGGHHHVCHGLQHTEAPQKDSP